MCLCIPLIVFWFCLRECAVQENLERLFFWSPLLVEDHTKTIYNISHCAHDNLWLLFALQIVKILELSCVNKNVGGKVLILFPHVHAFSNHKTYTMKFRQKNDEILLELPLSMKIKLEWMNDGNFQYWSNSIIDRNKYNLIATPGSEQLDIAPSNFVTQMSGIIVNENLRSIPAWPYSNISNIWIHLPRK